MEDDTRRRVKPARRFWLIEAREGFETVYSKAIPAGAVSSNQLKETLARLYSHFSLTPDEIVAGSVKRGTKVYSEFYHFNINSGPGRGRYAVSIGDGIVHLIASIWTEDELKARHVRDAPAK